MTLEKVEVSRVQAYDETTWPVLFHANGRNGRNRNGNGIKQAEQKLYLITSSNDETTTRQMKTNVESVKLWMRPRSRISKRYQNDISDTTTLQNLEVVTNLSYLSRPGSEMNDEILFLHAAQEFKNFRTSELQSFRPSEVYLSTR